MRKARSFLPKAPASIVLGLVQCFHSEAVYEGRSMRPRYTFLVLSCSTMWLCLYSSYPRMHFPKQSFWITQLEDVLIIADQKVALESKNIDGWLTSYYLKSGLVSITKAQGVPDISSLMTKGTISHSFCERCWTWYHRSVSTNSRSERRKVLWLVGCLLHNGVWLSKVLHI